MDPFVGTDPFGPDSSPGPGWKVIDRPDSNEEFLTVLTPVDTVDNSGDALRDKGTTRLSLVEILRKQWGLGAGRSRG